MLDSKVRDLDLDGLVDVVVECDLDRRTRWIGRDREQLPAFLRDEADVVGILIIALCDIDADLGLALVHGSEELAAFRRDLGVKRDEEVVARDVSIVERYRAERLRGHVEN